MVKKYFLVQEGKYLHGKQIFLYLEQNRVNNAILVNLIRQNFKTDVQLKLECYVA